MAVNFQIVLPNKLYRSGTIMPGDIDYLVSPMLKVKRIISLDQSAGNLIAKYIPPGIQHIIYPMLIGNPTVEARGLEALIQNNMLDINDGAVIIHCAQGKDRTGFAIALYRAMKQHWDCEKIFDEAHNNGYGTGLDKNVKKVFDMEICRFCSGDYCKQFTIKNDVLETGPDSQPSNDGFAVSEITPPAFSSQQSWSLPMDPTTNFYPGTVRTAKRKLRKRFLKKLLKKKDVQDLNVGLINNMDVLPNSSYNSTSGAIDLTPNAAGPASSSTLPQI